MEIQGVTGSGSGDASSTQSASTSTVMGKDDFLKLLMAQLQYQDPMQPMDNSQFVSQMAQFSSLEQMNNMTTAMTQLSTTQEQATSVAEATALIGKNVTMQVPNGTDASGNAQYKKVQGTVGSVQLLSGWPKLMVDGTPYDLSYVSEIA